MKKLISAILLTITIPILSVNAEVADQPLQQLNKLVQLYENQEANHEVAGDLADLLEFERKKYTLNTKKAYLLLELEGIDNGRGLSKEEVDRLIEESNSLLRALGASSLAKIKKEDADKHYRLNYQLSGYRPKASATKHAYSSLMLLNSYLKLYKVENNVPITIDSDKEISHYLVDTMPFGSPEINKARIAEENKDTVVMTAKNNNHKFRVKFKSKSHARLFLKTLNETGSNYLIHYNPRHKSVKKAPNTEVTSMDQDAITILYESNSHEYFIINSFDESLENLEVEDLGTKTPEVLDTERGQTKESKPEIDIRTTSPVEIRKES